MPKSGKHATTDVTATAPTTPSPPPKPGMATAKGQPKQGMAEKTARSETLDLRVTAALKQRFKQAAKEQGLKKAAFLEKLLAEWQARQPVPPIVASQPVARPAKTAKKPGRAAPKRKA